jgi:hypothetical protein
MSMLLLVRLGHVEDVMEPLDDSAGASCYLPLPRNAPPGPAARMPHFFVCLCDTLLHKLPHVYIDAESIFQQITEFGSPRDGPSDCFYRRVVTLVAIALIGGFLAGTVVTVLALFIGLTLSDKLIETRSERPRTQLVKKDIAAPDTIYQ